jgi:hypothetical protein
MPPTKLPTRASVRQRCRRRAFEPNLSAAGKVPSASPSCLRASLQFLVERRADLVGPGRGREASRCWSVPAREWHRRSSAVPRAAPGCRKSRSRPRAPSPWPGQSLADACWLPGTGRDRTSRACCSLPATRTACRNVDRSRPKPFPDRRPRISGREESAPASAARSS